MRVMGIERGLTEVEKEGRWRTEVVEEEEEGRRERSSGGLSVGERSVRVWGGEVTWVSGKRGRESMIVVRE